MSLKIFIADDSMIIVEKLINILSEIKGFKISGKTYDASKAAGIIRKLNPDVVILDIRLYHGSGIDVLKQIKKERPSLIVIMLTNYPEADYRKVCLEEGADYFLDKSTEFEKVIDICKSLLLQKNYIEK